MRSVNTSILFFCLLFLSFSAAAEIGITGIAPNTTSNSCNGSFTVVADGTAGPFTVRLPNPIKGEPDLVYTNVAGSVTIEALCNGSYSVEVFPSRFPTCVTKLDAELKPLKEPISGAGKAAALTLEVSPNPTRGQILVTATAPTDVVATGNWTVTLLDANAQPLFEQSVDAASKSAQLSLPLNLSRYPKGLYFIRVRNPAGGEETGRVVLQ
jgi:hypothetical protein